MSLLSRIEAGRAGVAETRVATVEQPERDGSAEVATPAGRPRWLARQDDPEAEGNTMNRLDRDETGWASTVAA